MSDPKPEQGGEEKYRAMWERLKASLAHETEVTRIYCGEIKEMGVLHRYPSAAGGLAKCMFLTAEMQRVEAESGGKE